MSITLALHDATQRQHVIDRAAQVIGSGGVIVYPTETLYGIGANALDRSAVKRVLDAKQRDDGKPILVIVDSQERLTGLVKAIPACAMTFIEAFWPGPLTLVFQAKENLPIELTQGSGTIGVRIPSNDLCLELIQRCDAPLTSTSANVSGEPVLPTVDVIRQALGERIDLYIDAGSLPPSEPSTVVSVVYSSPKLLRQGAIPFEDLQRVVPHVSR